MTPIKDVIVVNIVTFLKIKSSSDSLRSAR